MWALDYEAETHVVRRADEAGAFEGPSEPIVFPGGWDTFWAEGWRWIDDERLTFSCWRPGRMRDADVCIVDPGRGTVQALKRTPDLLETSAIISPRGDRFAVSATNALYVTSAGGEGMRTLVRATAPSDNPMHVDWRPR